MYGRFSVKAILAGFLANVIFSGLFSTLCGFLVGTTLIVSTSASNAAANTATTTAQAASQMNTPPAIIVTILAGVLGALLGGYISGVLAPGAEVKTAIALSVFSVVAFALLWALVVRGGGSAAPTWVTLTSFLLMIPATIGGGALRALQQAPTYSPETGSFRAS